MSSTLGKASRNTALYLIAALFMALVLAAGAHLGRAMADDAVDNSFTAGQSTLVAAADDGTYPLWVGETHVTSENLTGPGWSFDPDTNTLTLSGFSYEGAGHEEQVRHSDDDEDEGYYYRHAPIY